MKAEVSKIVEQFDIKIVKSIEDANTIMDKYEKSDIGYACVVSGKLSKQGDNKYYAVCTLDKPLSANDKVTLARLYLETVILHVAVRDLLVDKLPAITNKKSRGNL